MEKQKIQKTLFSVPEYAELMGVDRSTILVQIKRKKLMPGVIAEKVGKQWIIKIK